MPILKLLLEEEHHTLAQFLICAIGLLSLTLLSAFLQLENASSRVLYYWAGLTLTTPILYLAGFPWLRSVLKTHSTYFSIDIPLIIALLAAYFYSVYQTLFFIEKNHAYFDSILMILFIVSVSRHLETVCDKRVKQSIQQLNTVPLRAKVYDANHQLKYCQLEEIQIGDKLYIAPGEYFPVDGTLCDHEITIDESMLSGESRTLVKSVGELVRAGSCNLYKAAIIQVTHHFNESYFGKIFSSIQQQVNKHPEQPTCDQIALWYQIMTLTFSAAIFCWWLPIDSHLALSGAIQALLVTCSCALAIIHPFMSSCLLETCAQQGILVKNIFALLKFSLTQSILFDKTGTLTEGNLIVTKIEFVHEATLENVLPLIYAIKKEIHHPIAYAIVRYAQDKVFTTHTISELRIFPGKGVSALVNEKTILVGGAAWLKKNGVFIPPTVVIAQQHNNEFIHVHCAIDGIEVARIQLKDNLRQHAAEVMEFLKKQNIEIMIVSGDRTEFVNAIAKQLGPIMATGQVLPQAKEARVAALQEKGHLTTMVGDGLNDAPALSRADVGITLGSNNPISLLSADIIFKNPELKLIKHCYLLSQSARKILKQNILMSLTFSCIMLPFAALGQLSPSLILISLSLSVLLAIANICRLKLVKFTEQP